MIEIEISSKNGRRVRFPGKKTKNYLQSLSKKKNEKREREKAIALEGLTRN